MEEVKPTELRVTLQQPDGKPRVLSLEFKNPIEVLAIIARCTQIVAQLVGQPKDDGVIQNEDQLSLDLETSHKPH